MPQVKPKPVGAWLPVFLLLERQVRRILEFLEVPFEEACLDFHRTERSVRTPSSEQVRQPIYRSGLEYWRNFEPYLDAMKTGLAEEIASYPR